MGLPLGGGIGGIVLLLVVSALTGTNPLDLINSSAPQEQTWREQFQGRGEAYAPPILLLFDGATQSACGVGRQEMGPFYCPADQTVYLDLSFFRELDERFGAPGDFAKAYVVAHEVGHHHPRLLGEARALVETRSRNWPDRGLQYLFGGHLRRDEHGRTFYGVQR